jgi:SAM-dependent methyltransferase
MFQAITKIFRYYWFYASPTKLVTRRTIRSFFKATPPLHTIIEIGGGTAMMRPIIKKTCQCSKYISTDIAPTENTDVVCDATDMIFEDNEADAIVAFEVMEHIEDTNKFLSESARVIKSNGYLILSVPFMYGVHDLHDFHRWTSEGLESEISKHGFTILLVKNKGGTFLSIITLLSTYIHALIIPKESDWRSKGILRKLYFGFSTILMLPFTIASWLAFFLDEIIDRNSINPSSYILIAKKN